MHMYMARPTTSSPFLYSEQSSFYSIYIFVHMYLVCRLVFWQCSSTQSHSIKPSLAMESYQHESQCTNSFAVPFSFNLVWHIVCFTIWRVPTSLSSSSILSCDLHICHLQLRIFPCILRMNTVLRGVLARLFSIITPQNLFFPRVFPIAALGTLFEDITSVN